MKIYLSHSANFDFKKKLYKPIKVARLGDNFIFPHEKSMRQNPLKKLFLSKKIDFIIAEVSYPSTGQGIELGWANIYNIPIICIYKKKSSPSKSLKTVTKKFIKYTDEKDLIKKLNKIICSQ